MGPHSSCKGQPRRLHTQLRGCVSQTGSAENGSSLTNYLPKVGLAESKMNSNSIPSAMDVRSDGDQPTARQSVEDTDSDRKQPTDTVTGVAEPKNGSSTKGRIRTVFSEEQKRQLLQRFHWHRYISPQERAELARALGLTCKQVKTWYQNRRMKMKRIQQGQYPANSWNQPNFSASSSQTFQPDMMQRQFVSYGQESFLQSSQVRPFGVQNSPLENPGTKVLPPPTMHGDSQNSASFHLQTSQLPTQSGPHFGNYGSEPPMIPEAPSAGFTNQVPGSGASHSSMGNIAISSLNGGLQCLDESSSYPPTQAQGSYPSGPGVAGSSQDAPVYVNDWASVKSGPVSGHVMFNPMLDTYNAGMPTLAKPIGQGLLG